jgi:hypothetical protein
VKNGLVLFYEPLVAVEAEVLAGFRQKFFRIACMGRMTDATPRLMGAWTLFADLSFST